MGTGGQNELGHLLPPQWFNTAAASCKCYDVGWIGALFLGGLSVT